MYKPLVRVVEEMAGMNPPVELVTRSHYDPSSAPRPGAAPQSSLRLAYSPKV